MSPRWRVAQYSGGFYVQQYGSRVRIVCWNLDTAFGVIRSCIKNPEKYGTRYGWYLTDEPLALPSTHCPQCQRPKIEKQTARASILDSRWPATLYRYKCHHCGWRSAELAEKRA